MKSALIVIGDPATRRMVLRGLGRHGWWVDSIETVEGALRFLGKYRRDVALIDWQIARGSGLALLTTIRKNRAWCLAPVVMMHHRVEVEAIERAFDLGANDFLSRPFSGEAVLKKLERWVYKRSDSTESLPTWT